MGSDGQDTRGRRRDQDYMVVKKFEGDGTNSKNLSVSEYLSITDSSPHALISKRSNSKKILEVTNKIIELLTEEWNYLEKHKDLYNDVMTDEGQTLKKIQMEGLQANESSDEAESQEGDSSGNETCDKSSKCQRFTKKSLNVSDGKVVAELIGASTEPMECVFVKDEEEEEAEKEEDDKDQISDIDAEDDFVQSEHWPMENKSKSIESDNDQGEIDEDNFQTVYISEDGTTVIGDKLSVVTCSECGERFVAKPEKLKSSKPVKCIKCSILANGPQKPNKWTKEALREGFLYLPKNSSRDATEAFTINSKVVIKKIMCGDRSAESPPKVHPGNKVLMCEECGRYFAQQAALDIHHRIHTGEKPFICLKCGKGFRSKGNLVSHQTVHTDDKQFQCSICDKYFKRSLGLIEHMRLHTGEKPFTCPDCGKCFSQRSAFSTHQKIHADGKVFTCFDCGRCFKTKADLRTHELVHLGDKPFQCTECGEGFTRRANLLRHQRTHSGVKPFSCPDCGKTFTRKLGLLKHERLHIREKAQAKFRASMAFVASQASP
ncbi:uncharacterized protein [Pyxicephalus adspersus]|uniref:uncharacterized protein isoform X2 n=1 Tax=Pyxicephalus adspersus TaxID=30357 RepID=UPI003B5993BE